MPWREGLVVVVGLLVGGCFFSAYQIASLTASGVSYVLSGKSLGDNALSLALHKDCASLRILEGDNICIDYDAVYENSWSAMASNWRMPEPVPQNDNVLLAGTADDPVGTPNVVAAAKAPDAPVFVSATATTVATLNLPAPATNEPKRRGLDFEGLVVPDWVVPEPRSAPWPRQAFTSQRVNFGGLALLGRDEGDLRAAPIVAEKPVSSEPMIYLVLGSFGKIGNAERLEISRASFKTKSGMNSRMRRE